MSLPASVAQIPRLPRSYELCGCITYSRPLPLYESEVYSIIVSGTFRTVLKQTFVNSMSSEDGQHCKYRFPIYDGISVVGFKCKFGSKRLYGLVKEKKEAEAIFDAAVAKSDTAGIIQQTRGERKIFDTRIGYVPAGERILVEVTYIGELKQDVDGIGFRIPIWIAPLYGINSPARHRYTSESVTDITVGIKITVDIILPEGQIIKGISSPSHMIAVSTGTISTAAQEIPTMNRASTTLSHATAGLEKDFILAIQSNDIGTPYALLEPHPTIPNHRALVLSFTPQFSPPNSLSQSPSEIVFVADSSNSFRANIPMVILALKVCLKSLPTSVKFNICSVGTKMDFLWPQSKDYNSNNLHEAMQYIAICVPSYGRMEPLKAIQTTIESRLSNMPLEIILLTGGNIEYQETRFAYISEQMEKAQGSIRIFCLGVHDRSTVLPALVERISKAGHGLSQCVQSGERLDASVVHMLRGALSTHVEGILDVKYEENDDFELVDKVTDKMEILLSEHEASNTSTSELPGSSNKDTNASEAYYPQIIQAPHTTPGLFAGTRTTIYLLMCPTNIRKNPITITIRSSSSDGSPILEIPIQTLTEKSTTIHQLAARKAIRDLEECRGWMYNQSTFEAQTLAEKEAVRLGETFQVINKWCSFVAVLSSDKEILNQKTFPPNLSDANSSSIIIPRALKPPPEMKPPLKMSPVMAAICATLPNMERHALWHPGRGVRVPLPSPSASGNFQQSPKVTEPRLSSGAEASILSTTATVNPPAPVASPISNITKVLALIDLQSFDGSWDANDKSVASILEFEILRPGLPKVIDNDVWITMLVVKFLEDSIPEEKNVWCLVVEKARRYVRARWDTIGDLASLEEMAGAAVQTT